MREIWESLLGIRWWNRQKSGLVYSRRKWRKWTQRWWLFFMIRMSARVAVVFLGICWRTFVWTTGGVQFFRSFQRSIEFFEKFTMSGWGFRCWSFNSGFSSHVGMHCSNQLLSWLLAFTCLFWRVFWREVRWDFCERSVLYWPATREAKLPLKVTWNQVSPSPFFTSVERVICALRTAPIFH